MTNPKNAGIINLAFAGVAHLVERDLAKVEVASSSLVARSKRENPIRQDGIFSFGMCRSTGELAASTCAKRVKSRGEAGLLRMARAIRGMPGSEFEPRRGRVTSPTRSAEPRSKSGVGGQRKKGNIFLKVFSVIAKCKSICYDCLNKRRDFCEFARI